MGFLSDLAKSAGKALNKNLEEVNNYKARLSRASSDTLKRDYRNASGAKKQAIYLILKERGEWRD